MSVDRKQAFDIVVNELRRLGELSSHEWEREQLYMAAGVVRRTRDMNTPTCERCGHPAALHSVAYKGGAQGCVGGDGTCNCVAPIDRGGV